MMNRIARFFAQLDAASEPEMLAARQRTVIHKKLTQGPADGPLAAYRAKLLKLHQATDEAHALLASLAEASPCAAHALLASLAEASQCVVTALKATADAKLALLEEVRQQPALLKMLGIE
jgi:hypothetical protein